MKKAVWKFPLPIEDDFSLKLPRGAKILSLQNQYGIPTIWALCETDEKTPKVERNFFWLGTGHERPEGFFVGLEFIGTVQLEGGALVFHLFEETGK